MAYIGIEKVQVRVPELPRLGRHWPASLVGWMKSRRDERALRIAADRLDALSLHMLADIGLEYGLHQND